MSNRGRGAFLERTSFTGRNRTPPLVTIIVPHYRDVQAVARSLGSLKAQSYEPTELI